MSEIISTNANDNIEVTINKSAESILVCRGVSKSYSSNKSVLKNLSLEIGAGRIVGLLGPNGCGKTTLIKMIAGLLVPDSGEIRICGKAPGGKTNSLISYLPERPYFSTRMKVSDLCNYFADFYKDFDKIRAYNMLKELNIDPNAQMKTLSKGTKEKVQLILVMSRRARLYILDEPIGGVDPAARDYILSTIIGNYDPSATVLMTTHLISDIESAIDDFIFMGADGKIILSGNADQIREEKGCSLNELFREVFKCESQKN